MPKPYFYSKQQVLDEILRVNHAGEYGAVQIYQGQISSHNIPILHEMLSHEEKHLAYFEQKIQTHGSRPTIFLPIWRIGGYFLGKITALINTNTAMLCTEAVEDVINEHYLSQKQILKDIDEPQLAQNIEQFRLEELHHKNIAINHGSTDAKLYFILKFAISRICRTAIFLSKSL
jgi:3-demethoxyubiquinol 3-hydroxylase